MDEKKYFLEQFDDIKILRYDVPVFDSLTLKEKLFVYYLSRAALAGRDILWDQNNRYNLRLRKVLEKILRDYKGDREAQEFQHFLLTGFIIIIRWRNLSRSLPRNTLNRFCWRLGKRKCTGNWRE